MSESESAITTPAMSRRRRRQSSGKKKADPTIALIRERNLDVIIANELSISRQAVSQWKKVLGIGCSKSPPSPGDRRTSFDPTSIRHRQPLVEWANIGP